MSILSLGLLLQSLWLLHWGSGVRRRSHSSDHGPTRYYRSLRRPPSVPLSPQALLLPLGNSLHLPEFLHSGRLPSSVFQSIPVPHKFNPIMHVCSRSQSSHNDAATAQIAASLDLQSTPYSAVPCPINKLAQVCI